MNIEELEIKLKEYKIPEWYYNTKGKGMDDERYNIINDNGKWSVYYGKKGQRSNEKIFDNESDACEYMYDKLTTGRHYSNPNSKLLMVVACGIIILAIIVYIIIRLQYHFK